MPELFQNEGKSPADLLLEHCRYGNLEGVTTTLKSGVEVNSRMSGKGYTGLMIALVKNHNEVVKLLLEQPDLDVNMNYNGSTAVHYAVHGNNLVGLHMLLHRKDLDSTSVNKLDKNWTCTPLKLALLYNYPQCFSLLLADKRCDPNQKDIRDCTPLMFAVAKEMPNCVSLLLDNPRVDPNIKRKGFGSALMYAVTYNRTKVLTLVKYGHNDDGDNFDTIVGRPRRLA